MLGCSERPVNHSDLFWADKPVIAERRVVDGDTVIVCDVGKIMDKVVLPFEVIATDYQMIPLGEYGGGFPGALDDSHDCHGQLSGFLLL